MLDTKVHMRPDEGYCDQCKKYYWEVLGHQCSVTSAEPPPSSSTVKSYAQDAEPQEIALIPSPILNGHSDNRTFEEKLTHDTPLCPGCFPNATEQQKLQPGWKFDANKPRTDLLPIYPMIEEAKVLAYGAAKYDARNWEKGFDWSRAYGALLRHLFAFWQGENVDPESGLYHLAHARCCLDFLFEFTVTHPEFDDRPKVEFTVTHHPKGASLE